MTREARADFRRMLASIGQAIQAYETKHLTPDDHSNMVSCYVTVEETVAHKTHEYDGRQNKFVTRPVIVRLCSRDL